LLRHTIQVSPVNFTFYLVFFGFPLDPPKKFTFFLAPRSHRTHASLPLFYPKVSASSFTSFFFLERIPPTGGSSQKRLPLLDTLFFLIPPQAVAVLAGPGRQFLNFSPFPGNGVLFDDFCVRALSRPMALSFRPFFFPSCWRGLSFLPGCNG